jgi:Uma2 family endonuclease
MAVELGHSPTGTQTDPPARMTYEEFLRWADEDTRAEWVDGEVVTMSPASSKHQVLLKWLVQILDNFVVAKGSGLLLFAPFQMKTGAHLAGREPDLLFVATPNLSRLKDTHLEGPADLVVEIISPESFSRDRGEKFREYEEGGVREYWLIDPGRRQAEFYVLGEDGLYATVFAGREGTYRSAVLDGLWLQAEWLWQEPMPPLLDILRKWELI